METSGWWSWRVEITEFWKTHVAPAQVQMTLQTHAANRAQFLGISSQFLRTLVLWLVGPVGLVNPTAVDVFSQVCHQSEDKRGQAAAGLSNWTS
jgi:hypothetical protein